MSTSQDAFLKFQEELAALDKKDEVDKRPPTTNERMRHARKEFDDLCARYQLSLAEVVAFFPGEEGIDYLRNLIDQAKNKPRRGRKPAKSASS